MNNILGMTKQDLETYFLNIQEKKFKATQVYEWLYQKRVFAIDEFSNIKKETQERMKQDFDTHFIQIEKKQEDEDYNYDYGEKKKSSFGKYFLIGFVVLVVLVGIALCLYFFVFNKDEDNTIKNVKVNNDNLGAITMVISEESNSLTATAHTKGNATFLGWAKDGLYGSIVVSEDVNLTISLDDESNYYALFNLTIDTTVYRNIQYTLYEEAHLAVATGVEDFSDETLEIPQVIMDSNANYQVYKIAGGAFANLDSVQSVRLNDKIIYIADNAFSGCDNITSVFVPSTNLYYEVVDGDLVDKNGNVLIDTPSVEEGEATESLLAA